MIQYLFFFSQTGYFGGAGTRLGGLPQSGGAGGLPFVPGGGQYSAAAKAAKYGRKRSTQTQKLFTIRDISIKVN